MRKAARPLLRVGPNGLDAALLRDARFLADPRLLEALHGELRRGLGAREATAALLQLGAHHGYRDALAVARDDAPRSRRGDAPAASAMPLLAIQLASGHDEHGVVLTGTWPNGAEAEAVLASQGPDEAPACFTSAGYTSGWLSALGADEIVAVERSCVTAGADRCAFEARDAAAWRALGDRSALAQMALFSFDALRDRAQRELPDLAEEAAAAFDPESSAVHVWGPVMVVPYAGEETAVTIESVSRDPGAAQVSVVVVDLAGAVVDDGFGAVALERILDVVQGWGAEAVLTGLSPLSERVVAGLAGDPIVVPKDLRDAIATAFRIAESQRRAL
jgi:anti-anti-sigma regulatory factor